MWFDVAVIIFSISVVVGTIVASIVKRKKGKSCCCSSCSSCTSCSSCASKKE